MSRDNDLGGSYRTTRELMMIASDRLPAEARRALANAVENWVPQPFVTKYRRGQLDAADIVQRVALWDRKELAARENQRARAVGPYKGNTPDKPAPLPRTRRRTRR